jgi:hypothetical protein
VLPGRFLADRLLDGEGQSVAKTRQEKREERVSGRAQRRIQEEQSRKRRLYVIAGGIAAAIVLIAVIAYAASRGGDEGDGLLPVVAMASEISAPIDGRIAGEAGAPVTVVEWGDYQ